MFKALKNIFNILSSKETWTIASPIIGILVIYFFLGISFLFIKRLIKKYYSKK